MSPSSAQYSGSDGRITFTCPGCGKKLSVSHRLAGVSAPCPSCAAVIRAPDPSEFVQTVTIPKDYSSRSARSPAIHSRKSSPRRSKGHIVADSNVDRGDLDRRETAKTLFILMLFILAVCACLLVSWFLSAWAKN